MIQKYENRLQGTAQWWFRLIIGIEIQCDANYTIGIVFDDETVRFLDQWCPNCVQQFFVVNITDIRFQLLLQFGFLNKTGRNDSAK